MTQAKGRLRTFLLGSLQNFLINEPERARALKRGGKYEILSFDQHLPEAEAPMSGTAHLNDVRSYDLTWASNVVKRSWQDLHEAFAAEGKAKLLEELKPFVAGGMATPPNQEDVAARPGWYRYGNFFHEYRQRHYAEALATRVGLPNKARCLLGPVVNTSDEG